MTGISDEAEVQKYPFRPDEIVDSVADLLPTLTDSIPTLDED